MEPQAAEIVFEQPLSERIRSFLRLEHLFAEYEHHRNSPSPFAARARLDALLDVLTILGRSDLKSEIYKDLSEQQTILKQLSNRPGVDNVRLQDVLSEIDHALNNLQQLGSEFASSTLQGNEFLQSIINRNTVPGGKSAFDLPAMSFWLSQPPQQVSRDIDSWFADLIPFAQAILLDLRILRGIVPAQQEIASKGAFAHAPQHPSSLLRIFVPRQAAVYPEVSAGTLRFTIRFLEQKDVNRGAVQTRRDIPFRLQCCSF